MRTQSPSSQEQAGFVRDKGREIHSRSRRARGSQDAPLWKKGIRDTQTTAASRKKKELPSYRGKDK